jgi:hypothetical protein
MSLFWWSWLLTAVGVTGFLLAANKIWWAWYVNLGCQALWVTYAIVSHQPGFIAASLVYTVVFGRNAIRWSRDHRRCQTQPPWDLTNAQTCILRRDRHDQWHADGTGYISNDHEFRWMGEPGRLPHAMRTHPARKPNGTEETYP